MKCRQTTFGPWSTAIHSGGGMPLGLFWKARMAGLAAVAGGGERPRKCTICALILAGLLVGIVPTMRAEGLRQVADVEAGVSFNDDAPNLSGSSGEPEMPKEKAAMPEGVERAVRYLVNLQSPDGSFVQKDTQNTYATG